MPCWRNLRCETPTFWAYSLTRMVSHFDALTEVWEVANLFTIVPFLQGTPNPASFLSCCSSGKTLTQHCLHKPVPAFGWMLLRLTTEKSVWLRILWTRSENCFRITHLILVLLTFIFLLAFVFVPDDLQCRMTMTWTSSSRWRSSW